MLFLQVIENLDNLSKRVDSNQISTPTYSFISKFQAHGLNPKLERVFNELDIDKEFIDSKFLSTPCEQTISLSDINQALVDENPEILKTMKWDENIPGKKTLLSAFEKQGELYGVLYKNLENNKVSSKLSSVEKLSILNSAHAFSSQEQLSEITAFVDYDIQPQLEKIQQEKSEDYCFHGYAEKYLNNIVKEPNPEKIKEILDYCWDFGSATHDPRYIKNIFTGYRYFITQINKSIDDLRQKEDSFQDRHDDLERMKKLHEVNNEVHKLYLGFLDKTEQWDLIKSPKLILEIVKTHPEIMKKFKHKFGKSFIDEILSVNPKAILYLDFSGDSIELLSLIERHPKIIDYIPLQTLDQSFILVTNISENFKHSLVTRYLTQQAPLNELPFLNSLLSDSGYINSKLQQLPLELVNKILTSTLTVVIWSN